MTDQLGTAAPGSHGGRRLRLGVIGAGAWAIKRLARDPIEAVSRG